LVLVWEVADCRDVTDVECAWRGSMRVLLLALVWPDRETEWRCDGVWRVSCACAWDGAGTRFVVELAAEGKLEALDILVVLAFGFCCPATAPSPES
jgi:hypothetical protein